MRYALLAIAVCQLLRPAHAQNQLTEADRLEFFETKIRPVLVEHCYKCHATDSEALKANLLLDTASGTLKGGDSGPAVVPNKPEDSLLLSALRYDAFEMPPGQQLPAEIIADFESWIAHGAVDPRTSNAQAAGTSTEIDIAAGRRYWAFQIPQRADLRPGQGNKAELRDSDRIDALVDQRLTQHRLTANRAADRRTLLRRLSFDLVGLPPTPEQVADFVNADAPDIAAIVDQLLDSPTYGQRWARMWLDVARYAEDQAHIVGSNKELFYPNAYKYRDWVIAALNEDMPYDRFIQLQLAADLVAPENEEFQPALGYIGLGPKYYRRSDPEVMAEEWEDRVDVVSRGIQGLTVACARCHDHKYDPIRTEDYYALAGVFASTDMYNKPLKAAADTPAQKKDEAQKKGDSKKEKKPEAALHVIREGKVQDLAVMIRGKVDNKGDIVPRGFPEVLFDGPRRTFSNGSGRLELAQALTDPANPLTARVIVNRVWGEYFGNALVATRSNFGQLGDKPTHPELLDDLAVRFMQNGWSLKWLHRQIVLTSAYQRSSDINPAAIKQDPENKWLWRMPRRRQSIETWRDSVLFVAGTLDAATGGVSIRVDDPEANRRTIYAEVSRFELNPMLARFDFPDPNVHAARRVETNTPLQKLFLLNNPFMITQAGHLATRIESQPGDTGEHVRRLFQLAYQRDPDGTEAQAAVEFLSQPSNHLNQMAQAIIASNEFWYID